MNSSTSIRRILLVTGMSGAGKSVALRSLEDVGFQAVDNVPLSLLVELVGKQSNQTQSLVIGTDVRSHEFSQQHFEAVLATLTQLPGVHVETLFLDCEDERLRQRYTETRRKHPLATDRPLVDGIHAEREILQPLKALVEGVVDTTSMSPTELRALLQQRYDETQSHLNVHVMSFSFKQGLPREADLVFDVRFLRNPHYHPDLREKTGLEDEVGAYIEEDPIFAEFYEKLCGLVEPLLPRYLAEGKSYLTVAVGCTGGKHRSVHTAKKLAGFLENKGYKVGIRHRDVGI